MSQLPFLSIGLGKKRFRYEKFLQEMDAVMPWDRLCNLIRPHYVRGKGTVHPYLWRGCCESTAFSKWYGLSDPAVEEAIYDRNSFQRFLSVDPLSDAIPDEMTFLNFWHVLECHDLARKIFEKVDAHLTERGFLLRESTIVDTTLIAAPSSTKSATQR